MNGTTETDVTVLVSSDLCDVSSTAEIRAE